MMISFSDVYGVIKDIISVAKEAKNEAVIEKLLELQELFFELRENNYELEEKIKKLKAELDLYQNPKLEEKDLEYSPKGFFTIKGENPKIPYCSFCWKRNKYLSPLSQYGTWYKYRCGGCNSEIVVMGEMGNDINT